MIRVPRATAGASAVRAVVARLAALSATLCILVATTSPGECDTWSAPVAFRALGTCGAGGVVVVSVNGFSGTTTFANGAALGLPPNAGGRYTAGACPMTLQQGGWNVSIVEPTDASCNNDGGTNACGKNCVVDLVTSGPLRFRCTDATGAPLCDSTLMVLE